MDSAHFPRLQNFRIKRLILFQTIDSWILSIFHDCEKSVSYIYGHQSPIEFWLKVMVSTPALGRDNNKSITDSSCRPTDTRIGLFMLTVHSPYWQCIHLGDNVLSMLTMHSPCWQCILLGDWAFSIWLRILHQIAHSPCWQCILQTDSALSMLTLHSPRC